MPGTVLSVGLLGTSAVLAFGLAAAGAAATCAQRAASAADAAALAAADVASGAIVVDEDAAPCDTARAVADASGATVTDCTVEGLVATVSVRVPFGSLESRASARAGPPATVTGAPR